MATTTTVITDLPGGRIKVVTDYHPKPGERCTLAQSATLKIMAQTRKEYGLEGASNAAMPTCPKCGNNHQVWANQITGALTCHRAFCDTQISVTDAASVENRPV